MGAWAERRRCVDTSYFCPCLLRWGEGAWGGGLFVEGFFHLGFASIVAHTQVPKVSADQCAVWLLFVFVGAGERGCTAGGWGGAGGH